VAARATYVQVSDHEVLETVDITDLAMVDIDGLGQPVGVEFLKLPAEITPEMIEVVIDQFPALKFLREGASWSAPGAPRLLHV
jgi:uncharacterized protein YuzE